MDERRRRREEEREVSDCVNERLVDCTLVDTCINTKGCQPLNCSTHSGTFSY